MLQRLVPLAACSLALSSTARAQWVIAQYDGMIGTDFLIGVDDGEFTPDGRYFVIRQTALPTRLDVFDTGNGTRVFTYASVGASAVVQDAVAVTDDRAIVIGGSSAMIVDLNALAVIADAPVGANPRDVAITPDATMAAVRGGNGLYVFDLATGATLASAPGSPAAYLGNAGYDVDSVVASDGHAVLTSEVAAGPALFTRVTVFDLHPAGGGPPVVAFETTAANDQAGKPNDVAIAPNGTFAAVRSDMEVGYYELAGPASKQGWKLALHGNPGPFGASVMDSIEATDTRIATISRRSNATGQGAQLDVFTKPGVQKYQYLDGDPHDLAITPNGERVVARTHTKVSLFDIRNLPMSGFINPLDEDGFAGSHTSWDAGLDSIVATNDTIAAMSRNANETKCRIYDISSDVLDKTFGMVHAGKPSDIDFTPGGGRVLFGLQKSFLLVDARTGAVLLDMNGTALPGEPAWCDGVATTDPLRAAAFGVGKNNTGGWLVLLDLFEEPARYCATNPNSTGELGRLLVSGTPSVGSNDLVLWGVDLPANEFARFFYGNQQIQVPYGDGFTCVGGQVARFAVVKASAAGVAQFAVDNTSLPPSGGAILPGSTWNFQLVFRDTASTTATFNLTDALSVLFEN